MFSLNSSLPNNLHEIEGTKECWVNIDDTYEKKFTKEMKRHEGAESFLEPREIKFTHVEESTAKR